MRVREVYCPAVWTRSPNQHARFLPPRSASTEPWHSLIPIWSARLQTPPPRPAPVPGMTVFWNSASTLTEQLGPLHLICWETNGDLDRVLGERMRMWLALDHRSCCVLWSQSFGVCVGKEFVVLRIGQTFSGDQLTLEFISFETRGEKLDSPCASFLELRD